MLNIDWKVFMFLDFLGQIWRLPMMAFKRVLSNPMGLFVYGILSKWYIMVMLAVTIVTFWVFKGLKEAGVLDAAEKTVREGFLEVQAVAQHCTPKIMNLGKMWECINNIKGSDYQENEDAARLRKALEGDLQRNQRQSEEWARRQQQQQPAVANPYEQELANEAEKDSTQ
jgi:Protein of unknown function (DUF2670)